MFGTLAQWFSRFRLLQATYRIDKQSQPDTAEGHEVIDGEGFFEQKYAKAKGKGGRDILHDAHGGEGDTPCPIGKQQEREAGEDTRENKQSVNLSAKMEKSPFALKIEVADKGQGKGHGEGGFNEQTGSRLDVNDFSNDAINTEADAKTQGYEREGAKGYDLDKNPECREG